MINHNAEEYSVFVIVFELNSFTKVVFVFFFVVDIWIVFIWRARYQLPILTVIFNNSGIYSGFDKEVKYLLESTRFAIFDGDHDSPDYEGEYEDNDNGFHRDRSTTKLWATMSQVSPLQQLLSSRRFSRWKKIQNPLRHNKWPWNRIDGLVPHLNIYNRVQVQFKAFSILWKYVRICFSLHKYNIQRNKKNAYV